MSRLTRSVGALAVCLLFILPAGSGQANPGKLAKDLAGAGRGGTVNAIIQFRSEPGDTQMQKLRRWGATEKRRLRGIKATLVNLPQSSLDALAADPEVVYVSPDRPVRAFLDYARAAAGAAMAQSYGWNGDGVGIAVIDSGIADHWDLRGFGTDSSKLGKSRIVYRESFVAGQEGSNANVADDQFGHGTHVAGIAGGTGWSTAGSKYSASFRGMAPKANFINFRVLDENGTGSESAVIAAIERAIQLKDTYNIRVINLSLGRPVFESYRMDPLCQAAEAAWRAGIVVVVSAGNYGRLNEAGTQGYGTITSPGNDPYVITVGAMKTVTSASRADDRIASYSSKGPTAIDHVVKPDLVAPGNRTISLMYKVYNSRVGLSSCFPENIVPTSYYATTGANAASDTYFWLSGTSMAAPMVSGTVALMLQKDPQLTPDQVKARLMKSASKSFPALSTSTDPDTGETYWSQYDICGPMHRI